MLKLHRNRLQEFIKLSNRQWMKIEFIHWIRKETPSSCWGINLVVANSKRQCNDCLT
jgi:hypothetical protein